VKTNLDFILSERPTGGWKWAMQALLIAVSIQVFTTAIVFFTTSHGYDAFDQDQQEVVTEEIPLQFEEETPSANGSEDEGPLRNVMSMEGAELGDGVYDHTGQRSEMSPEEYAKRTFDELKEKHKNDPKPERNPSNLADPKPNPDKDPNPPSGKNTAGAVTAEWSLAGRTVSNGPKPTYRCKQGGMVKVNVVVDDKGQVKSASIDPSSTNFECLMDESLAHAKKWRFNAALGKPNQNGTIVFRFSAQ
jgi:TonB family protein